MVRSNKREHIERSRFLIGVAMTCVAGGLPLLGVSVPRLPGALLLLAGCAMFLWWSWDKSSHYHIAVRIGAISFVLLFFGYTAWLMYTGRKPDSLTWEQLKPAETTQSTTPVSVQHRQVILHEFNVVFYNGVNDPEFFIDGKLSRPAKYSSGIATFRLVAGSYTIRAEYQARTCSAIVFVPLSEPAAASCHLK